LTVTVPIRAARITSMRLLTHSLLFIALLGCGNVSAQTSPAAALLAEAAAAEARFDVPRALDLYLAADRLDPDRPATLQKIAQQLSDLSLKASDNAAKKARAEKALDYARRAVALQPDNAVNVLSLAICHGKLAVFSDTRAKIEYSRLVKQEAERALALDPAYDWAHHVLGRWHYEIASLGGTARFFIRLIYGGLPPATFADAINHLEKAVSLAPRRVPHHLELGFALLAAGRKAEARASFARGLALPSVELYDESAKVRAREALEKL
jgi:tetratricopeptide (TPR) repeat protein